MKGKKGSVIPDVILVMVILLVFGMTLIISYKIGLEMRSDITAQINNTVSNKAQDNVISAMENYDYMFLFLMVIAFLGVIIGAVYIQSHPIFFVISVFFLIFVTMMAAVLSNVFETFTQNANIAQEASTFDIIIHLMGQLPMYVWIMGLIGLVIMVAKLAYREA